MHFRNMSSLWGYVEFMGICRVYGDMSSLWGYVEFMGICRVYGDMSSLWDISSYHLHILHCKIMTVSHVTYLIFHGDCTNNYRCPEG